MLLSKRKNNNLIKILAELTGDVNKERVEQEQQVRRSSEPVGQIKSITITVEIPGLDNLIQELRMLREAVTTFVNLVKSRLEESQEQQGSEQETSTS